MLTDIIFISDYFSRNPPFCTKKNDIKKNLDIFVKLGRSDVLLTQISNNI